MVVAATNNPKNIDTALHRRMPRQFYIGPPDREQRIKILNKILHDDEDPVPCHASTELIEQVAERTDKFCASDLLELCKVALGSAMRDGCDDFSLAHFDEAMTCVKYAGASADEQVYREMMN